MHISVICILGLVSFILTIISAMGKLPLWIPVFLLSIATLLQCMPLK